MFERFTDKARKVVILAKATATDRGDDQIRPVHMLYGLAATDGVAARALTALGADAAAVARQLDRAGGASPGPIGPREDAADGDAEALAAIGIDLEEIKRRVEESFGPGALGQPTQQGPLNWTGRMTLTRESKQSLGLALKEARALRHNYIGTEHLLLGLLSTAERNHRGDFTPDTLRELGIDPAQVRQRVLAELRRASALSRPPQEPHPAPSFSRRLSGAEPPATGGAPVTPVSPADPGQTASMGHRGRLELSLNKSLFVRSSPGNVQDAERIWSTFYSATDRKSTRLNSSHSSPSRMPSSA